MSRKSILRPVAVCTFASALFALGCVPEPPPDRGGTTTSTTSTTTTVPTAPELDLGCVAVDPITASFFDIGSTFYTGPINTVDNIAVFQPAGNTDCTGTGVTETAVYGLTVEEAEAVCDALGDGDVVRYEDPFFGTLEPLSLFANYFFCSG